MKTALRLTALIALVALAAAAPPAAARIDPPGSSVAGHALDPEFNFNNVESWCPDADFSGRIEPTGLAISGTVTIFNPTITCQRAGTTVSAPVACTNFRFTLRSTASIAGVAALGSIALDSGAECTVRLPDIYIGCDISFAGPQTLSGSWTFRQSTQHLDIDARGIALRTRGIVCPRGTGEFTATFGITRPRITIF